MSEPSAMRTFELRVTGFVTIKAETKEEALDTFEDLMNLDFLVKDLRWKSVDVEANDE